MRQIRRNVFETNSSSTHSCCICTKAELEQWKDGELLVRGWGNDEFVTIGEAIKIIKADRYYSGELDNMDDMNDDQIARVFEDYEFYTYETWSHDYEFDITRYTTPGGEEIVAVCYYGDNY